MTAVTAMILALELTGTVPIERMSDGLAWLQEMAVKLGCASNAVHSSVAWKGRTAPAEIRVWCGNGSSASSATRRTPLTAGGF